jgi:hypothetical protein
MSIMDLLLHSIVEVFKTLSVLTKYNYDNISLHFNFASSLLDASVAFDVSNSLIADTTSIRTYFESQSDVLIDLLIGIRRKGGIGMKFLGFYEVVCPVIRLSTSSIEDTLNKCDVIGIATTVA